MSTTAKTSRTRKPSPPTLDELRRYAIARSLFKPTTLPRAIARLGFVQADPMRAPARAQDLILRHRVSGYRAGDLEQRYARLKIEEDCLVNYGFVERRTLALLHPREARRSWDAKTREQAEQLLAAVRQRGPTHPKHLLEEFAHHGRQAGYWGGELNVSTQLLDGLHYRGQLRVKRRDNGTRVYEAIAHPEQDQSPAARTQRAEALLDMVLALYAPLTAASFGYLTSLLGYGAPHLRAETRAAFKRAKQRYAHAQIEGQTWYWPADENPRSRRHAADAQLRLLAPFDPVVWDRRRFELFWGWAYRFEAYTPAAKRQMGHYALPLLWGEEMPGWANLRVDKGRLRHELGFTGARPRSAAFRLALEEELARIEQFLGLA
ncbi:DNA glycosylase AlkZ-like family protein [Roseateles violae]|uniref:Crosslink repair DNA glycosylase YcaQ family protein n=1 Tax=Roseateles violae TaxID=3058042 RepID=A0ABT8DWP0_9BURK|nr:crosslink repair DNA glycosylase YcaQ family protein [Pelomonas sp. PFR6]MDN3921349.1 crosslink repair DNA glycosylase YcaQ family protein [Pelomonas sp. PFR6]